MKAHSLLITELAMEPKNFLIMTTIKASIKWVNFMAKACMFGLQALVTKEIFT
jgi:hypothetical protein